jgi:hypothetical protein
LRATEAQIESLASTASRFHPGQIFRAAWTDNRELLLVAAVFLAGGFLAEAVTGISGLMRDVFRQSFSIMLLVLFLPLPLAFLVGRLRGASPGFDSSNATPTPPVWRVPSLRR